MRERQREDERVEAHSLTIILFHLFHTQIGQENTQPCLPIDQPSVQLCVEEIGGKNPHSNQFLHVLETSI